MLLFLVIEDSILKEFLSFVASGQQYQNDAAYIRQAIKLIQYHRLANVIVSCSNSAATL